MRALFTACAYILRVFLNIFKSGDYMTELFKKLFIKDYQNVSSPEVRARYGTATGVLGIVANLFLFTIKFIAALLSGSVAVIADAVNNLTDFMTSIITTIGFKISGKPADSHYCCAGD